MLDIALSILWIFLTGLGVLIFFGFVFLLVASVGFEACSSKAVPFILVMAFVAPIVGVAACLWRSWVTLAYLGMSGLAILFLTFLLEVLTGKFALRNAYVPSAQKTPATKVPKGFLIDWLLPPELAEEALFNILGRYPYWVEKYGYRKARFIFGSQSCRCVLDYWTDWLVRRLKLLTLLTRT